MKRELSDIKKVIVHCSESDFGNLELIDRWHKERGWDGCGYHYIICNGIASCDAEYQPKTDGLIQVGRDLSTVGAHCRGQNIDSIGICLIGKRHFTGKQLLESLPDLLITLGHFGITSQDVFGHYEFSSYKTCPNIDAGLLRNMAFKTGIKKLAESSRRPCCPGCVVLN